MEEAQASAQARLEAYLHKALAESGDPSGDARVLMPTERYLDHLAKAWMAGFLAAVEEMATLKGDGGVQ